VAIYLIRHGETPGNANRVVQTPEVPLSPRGLEQAKRLGQRLSTLGVARILASDLRRAVMTAECLREACAAPLELDPLLQERNLGAVRGTPYAELRVDIFAPDFAPPEGETWDRFHERVDRAWQRVVAEAGSARGHLAVVTHGLVCLSLATRHLRLPAGAVLERGFANASLTLADATPPHDVRFLNCTKHLAGVGDGPGAAV
jgi:probable phosphoglycerate mutase